MSDKHHHHPKVSGKNLLITIVLNIIITVAQFIGGLLSGSLALLSDAMHNFSDVLSLIIAYSANKLSLRPSDSEKTFGYHRAEILAALFNSSILIFISIYLIFEAVTRLNHPEPIQSLWVISLGLLGIIVNGLSVFVIKDDAKSNMNFKAAYLHLLADVMTSVAVVVGGVLMYYFNIYWIDSIITILIAMYLLWASFALAKSAVYVLMQFVPVGLDLNLIIQNMEEIPQINNVHHVHLWQLDDNRIHIEAHLEFSDNSSLQEATNIIDILEKRLESAFGITHVTFQCEHKRCNHKEIIER